MLEHETKNNSINTGRIDLYMVVFNLKTKIPIFYELKYFFTLVKTLIMKKSHIWISIFVLLWSLMGVLAYLGQAYMDDTMFAALPVDQQNYYENLPSWVTAAFATAVFSQLLASILLLMKKALSFWFFIIAFVAVIFQLTYNLFLQTDMSLGGSDYIMPFLIISINVLFIYYSKKNKEEGFLK